MDSRRASRELSKSFITRCTDGRAPRLIMSSMTNAVTGHNVCLLLDSWGSHEAEGYQQKHMVHQLQLGCMMQTSLQIY